MDTTPEHDDRPESVTLSEAARRLGVGRDTLRRAIDDGELPAFRYGERTYRILLSDLQGLFVSQLTGERPAK